MTMRWVDIVVHTDRQRTLRGVGARRWVGEQAAALLPQARNLETRLFIRVNGASYVDDDALEYLRGRFGDQIEYDPQQRYRRGAPAHQGLNRTNYNVLQYPRPVYELTVSLGEIDALFDEVANDADRPWRRAGVQQRLQALGYLYTPLGHTKINLHAQRCWEHYKRVHTPNAGVAPTDAEAVALLKREIQNNLVVRAFPRSGQVLGAGALPAANAFGAIRFPGGYCFNHTATGGRGGDYTLGGGAHDVRDNQYDFDIGCNRFAIEDIVRRDNPKLGRFPIIAKVERVWPDGRRTAVADAPVHFQLRTPGDPAGPPFAAPAARHTVMDYRKDPSLLTAARPNQWNLHRGLTAPEWGHVQAQAAQALLQPAGALRTAFMQLDVPNVPNPKQVAAKAILQTMVDDGGPPLEVANAGPRAYVDDVLGHALAAAPLTDPQRSNCPHAHGGKQGQAAAGHVWELPLADETGFHLAGRGRRDMGTLARATASAGLANADAAQCISNAEGYAGVVLAPSSIAGDRYRIRVYLDHQWLTDHAVTATVEAFTGTLVVWRNVRMHRYIQKATVARAHYSAAVNALFDYPHANPLAGQNCNYFGDDAFDRMHIEAPVTNLAVLPNAALEPAYAAVARATLAQPGRYAKMYRPLQHQFIGFHEQLAQHYCELLDDSGGREAMTSDELRDAIARGRAVVQASGLVATAIHWPTLVFHDMTSPFLVTWRSFAEYNHLKPAGGAYPDLDPNNAVLTQSLSAASNLMVEVISEHFAKGGVLPGLTLLQVPRGESWDYRALNGPANVTSGYGIPCRTAIVSHTDDVYRQEFFIYSATSNAIHELGHVLAFGHQPPMPGGEAEIHQVQPANANTTPQAGECVCVMSYMGCYGEYCGRCGMALRGWHVQSQANVGGV